MSNAPRMQNLNGAANTYLKAAARKDGSSSLVGNAVKAAPKDQQQLVQSILNAIRAQIVDSDSYQLTLDSRSTDVILGRIATLLDQFKDDFVSDELAEVKEEILDAVSGLDASSIAKSILAAGISELFDQDAKKEDIEELKTYMTQLFNGESGSSESSESSGTTALTVQDIKDAVEIPEPPEDETEGDYQDSTPAENFQTLQDYIQGQCDLLNENINNISKIGIGAGVVKLISNSFSGVKNLTTSMFKKIGSISSSVVNISKNVAGGAVNVLAKTVKGIGSAVAGISKGVIGAVKGIGSKIKGIGSAVAGISKGVIGAVKGIGSKIKGIGGKIGGAIASPFKKIGSFFTRKTEPKQKKDKSAKFRERFMNFMMSMVEKLWNFLEPILSKLKVFMIAAMVPILLISIKVLAIFAAITLLIVGIVIAAIWIKKKVGQFVKWIKSKIPAIKAWFGKLWEGTKKVMKSIWNGIVYIISFKWLVDFGKWLWTQLVAFGKWIWNKLLEFGQWIYDKYLAPILDPIFKFYYEKIEPAIRPFIDSLKNLVGRIKAIWSNFHWDESKSFFENLKCLGSIVKDAVIDWWNNSPFKVFFDRYISPAVQSLIELIDRIKTIWSNFSWDENKSFIDNFLDLWAQIKMSIAEWWNGSVIREYFNNIVDFVTNIWTKIKDWWNNTTIGKWVNETFMPLMSTIGEWIKNKVQVIKEKLGAISFKIPAINPDASWRKPSTWFMFKPIQPFGFLKSLPAEGSTTKIVGKTDAGEDFEKDIDNAKDIPRQQIQGAMQPVNSIQSMNQQSNVELQKTGAEMSQRAAEDRAATYSFQQSQTDLGSQYLAKMNQLGDKIDEYGRDPAVVPLPVPYGPQRNAAMMERN